MKIKKGLVSVVARLDVWTSQGKVRWREIRSDDDSRKLLGYRAEVGEALFEIDYLGTSKAKVLKIDRVPLLRPEEAEALVCLDKTVFRQLHVPPRSAQEQKDFEAAIERALAVLELQE